MKKLLIILMIPFLFFSCTDELDNRAALQINIEDGSSSRTLFPLQEDLKVVSYGITGDSLDYDYHIERKFTGKTFLLEDIYPGNWNFQVFGYNAKNEKIANSSVENIYLYSSISESKTFQLNYSTEGKGTFSLQVESFDMSNMECIVTARNVSTGVETTERFPLTIDGVDKIAVFKHDMKLVPGSYELELDIHYGTNPGEEKYIESFEIYENTTTSLAVSWYAGTYDAVATPDFVNMNSFDDSFWAEMGSEMRVEIKGDPASRIYYTLDGSIPDENSIPYVDSILITDNTTLSAIAYKEGRHPSRVATKNIVFSVPDPVFEEVEDPNTGTKTLSIKNRVPGVTIRYFYDNLFHNSVRYYKWSNTLEYTEPLVIGNNVKITAKAFKQGYGDSHAIEYQVNVTKPDPGYKVVMDIPMVDKDEDEHIYCVWLQDGHPYSADIKITPVVPAELPVSVDWVYCNELATKAVGTRLTIDTSNKYDAVGNSGTTWVSAAVHIGPYVYVVHYSRSSDGSPSTYRTFVNGY